MKPRCAALIYVKDVYRRTGRGRSGFEMHYTEQQCSRPAREGDLCWQHLATPNILRCKWAQKYMEAALASGEP